MSGKGTSTIHPGQNRNDRLIQEFDHDPYHAKLKLKEPTACPQCCAVYAKGRWKWGQIPEDAYETLCPACQRIHDKVPAAFLTLSGQFFSYSARQKHTLSNVLWIATMTMGLCI